MSKCFLLLGRLGDLISVLPILYAESQSTGQPTRVMCLREYASLFGGCSYVKAVPFDGKDSELRRAWEQVVASGDQPVSLQVIGETLDVRDLTYGPAGFSYAMTDSFQKEPYWLTHQQSLWAKQPRPVFDGRSPRRERLLLDQHSPRGKQKSILVAATGRSSPFPYKAILMELLRGRFENTNPNRRYAVLDLDEFKAERFYDFLALLEQAHCLVAIDSAFLHLAHAVEGLPLCALVNDKPSLWNGSSWRSNHISYMRYSDFPFRAVDLLDAIERIGSRASYFNKESSSRPQLIHVWSQYEQADPDAHESWNDEYSRDNWIETPVPVGAFGRDSQHSAIKDNERYPFLKDVIRCGAYRAREDDIIVLTRANTCFQAGISPVLLKYSPCYSHRYIREDGLDTWHPAVDLFAATKKWWQEHWNEIPEFVLGPDLFWNRALHDLFCRNGGHELFSVCYRSPAVARSNSSTRSAYQEDQLRSYESRTSEAALFKPVVEQLPSVVINRHALPSYAYNPAIVRSNERILAAMRYHDQRDYSTALCIAEIDENGTVFGYKPVQLPHNGGSEEDARFFEHNGGLWMSYVDSTYPALPAKSVVKYGRLMQDTVWSIPQIYQPMYPGNDMSGVEKNWVMFDSEGTLYCIHSTSPKTVILEMKADTATFVAEYDGPRWAYGQPRGGTTPILYKGVLLRFFHSALDSDIPPCRRRYFVGAMTMEPKPPFKPIQISQRPILCGSELDTLTATERSSCQQYKKKVVFPLGAIDLGGGEFLLSCGVNDSHCCLTKVAESALNLREL